MSLSNRLKSLLDENPKKTQAGLARATGAKPASISDWVNGRTKSINSVYLTGAAAYLEVSSDWLATGKGPKYVVTGSLASEAGDTMQASASLGPTLEQAIEALALSFNSADNSTRETCAALLASLARNPGNHQRISTALNALLVGKTEVLQDPQLTAEEKDRARRLTEAAHAGEQFNLSQHGAKKSIT